MKVARESRVTLPITRGRAEAMQSHDSLCGRLSNPERLRPQEKGISPGKGKTPGFQPSPSSLPS